MSNTRLCSYRWFIMKSNVMVSLHTCPDSPCNLLLAVSKGKKTVMAVTLPYKAAIKPHLASFHTGPMNTTQLKTSANVGLLTIAPATAWTSVS